MELSSLDKLLVDRGLAPDTRKARAVILAGLVFSGEKRLDKAGIRLPNDVPLKIRADDCPYVSRGGLKLAGALDGLSITPAGRVCLDLGASTGGFTDCLLQRGALHVFSVDVGYGLLDSRLRGDARVSVIERTNARFLKPEHLISSTSPAPSSDGRIDLAVIDVSFISMSTVVEAVHEAFGPLEWVCLFKPQFEVERRFVLSGGLVQNNLAIEASMNRTHEKLLRLGLQRIHAPIESPIVGKKSGNVEYLLHYGLSNPIAH